MNTIPRRFQITISVLLLSLAIVLFTQQTVSAEFEEGVGAYKRGDYATALKEFRPLAEQGHATAQFNLGLMYAEGQGVPRDYKKAVMWYRKAADQGVPEAQFALGVMYDFGQGVPQDSKGAVQWYRKAAGQGVADAQFNLGLMYVKGEGILQNYVRAHMWFNLAGARGNKDAVKNRIIIEKRMTPSQIEEAQRLAREWKPKMSR